MRCVAYELVDCPICASRASNVLADADAVRDEVERLWAFHDHRLRSGVPTQRLIDRVVFSQHPPLRVEQCGHCGHVYRNPRERRESLEAAYAEDGISDEALGALLLAQSEASRAQARRFVAVAGEGGHGLEVGSYVGGFLAAAREAGWEFEGADLCRRAVAFAAASGFTVTCGSIETVGAQRRYDAVAIWNTFEQLYDVHSVVRSARDLLRPGGVFVVRVPSGRFYARWRARLCGPLGAVAERLLAHNNFLGFPYRQAFTPDSLGRLLCAHGLEVITVFGDTMVPISDEWTSVAGRIEERTLKGIERITERGWRAPWVEVYARALAHP